jgi:hypothetical protein
MLLRYTVRAVRDIVINHCDRHITLLSDTHTDISFGLFNLFTYIEKPFG